MEEKTVSERLDEILGKLEEKEKKKFKLPLGIRMGKLKLKKNYAVVIIIRTNGQVNIKMVKIEENTIKLDNGLYYSASAEYILRYKRYPLLIILEWNMQPLSPSENVKKAEDEGTMTAGEKYILAKMKADLIKPKLQIKWSTVLIVGAVLIAGYFLLDYLKVI